MYRLLGLLFIGLAVNSQAFSQTWVRMQSWGLDIESIAWIDQSKGFAVGENLIIQTTNGGITWEEIDVNFGGKLMDVVFWDENSGIAAGEHGLIMQTRDAGKTWSQKVSGVTHHIMSVAFSGQDLWAVTANGHILQSMDNGNTWQQSASGLQSSLNEITFINPDTAYIAGNQGRILRTFDKGKQWTLLSSGTALNLNGITFSTPSIGYAVGQEGIVLKTLDGGNTWSLQSSGVDSELRKIAVSPLNIQIITIVGEAATALRSTNSANTFGKANLGATNSRNLSSVAYIPGSNQVFASGQDGYLIRSTNGGATYSQLLAGVRNNFTSLEFKSDRAGLIAGEKGQFFLTANGGTSVVPRPLPENVTIEGMKFWNTSYGYAGADDGKIFRTSNAGNSWASVPAHTPESIQGFYLFSTGVLYIAGSNGYIARSFDSGASWDSQIQTNTSEDFVDLTFFDFQVGFAIGKNGQISWSDGGNTWENIQKPTDRNLNSLAKLSPTTAIVVGDGGTILKSEDQAKTWRKIETNETATFTSVDFWDDKLGFIVGESGITLQTKDGGETWLKISSGTSRNLNSVSVGNPLVAFAAGDDGSLLRYICSPPSGLGEINGNPSSCISTQTYSVPDSMVLGSELIWRVDGGEIISGQGSNTVQVLWKTPGRNGIYVSRENFCGTGRTSSLEVAVLSSPPMDSKIDGDGSVCIGQEAIYSISRPTKGAYIWTIDGGDIIAGQGSDRISVIWNVEGLGSASVVQSNSCGQTTPVHLPVKVSSPPPMPSPVTGNNLVGLWEEYYEVTDQEEVNFIWEISAGSGRILEGQGSNRVLIGWTKEGKFQLKVTPENFCNNGESQTLEVEVNVITSLPEAEKTGISIYPNPSSGTLTIQMGNTQNWKNLQIINSFGQEIQFIDLTRGHSNLKLDDLPKGLMILKFQTETRTITRKIVVN